MIGERKRQEAAVCVGSLIVIFCIVCALAVLSLLASCSTKRQAAVAVTESVETMSVDVAVKAGTERDAWAVWRNFLLAADTVRLAVSIDSLVTADGVKLYGVEARRTGYGVWAEASEADTAEHLAEELAAVSDSTDYRAESSLEAEERKERKRTGGWWEVMAVLTLAAGAVILLRRLKIL